MRIEPFERPLQRGAVHIGHDRHIIAHAIAVQRIDDQLGAKRGPADADMQNMADFAQRARLNRVDQAAHPLMQHLGMGDAVGIALTAFGGMFGGAAFAVVDSLPSEQRVAPSGKILLLRQVKETGQQIVGQMGLGPVEPDRSLAQHQLGQAIGIGGENGFEVGFGQRRDGGQRTRLCRAGHAISSMTLVDIDAAPVDSRYA